MKELLKQIKDCGDIELKQKHYDKLSGYKPIAGDKIEIYWVDREYPDSGYLFRLPIQDEDEDMLDLCVHATHVDNSDGMDKAPEEWCHLIHLLKNDRVEKVIVIS